jgi:hypothetical protein
VSGDPAGADSAFIARHFRQEPHLLGEVDLKVVHTFRLVQNLSARDSLVVRELRYMARLGDIVAIKD